MKRTNLNVVGTLAAMLVVLSAATALAAPLGTTYNVAGTNFPNDFTTTTVTFDGVAELVGGPSPAGMLVNESAIFRAGTPGGISTNLGALTEWEQSGIVTEFQFIAADAGPYNNDPGTWSLSVHDVDFGTNKAIEVRNTQYGYFVGPSGPVVISPVLLNAFGLRAGPHPIDPAITQVLYLENDENVFDMSMGVFPGFDLGDDGDLNANTIGILAGVTPLKGLVLGSMYQPVPEPSSVALALIGGLGLALTALKRRQRGR